MEKSLHTKSSPICDDPKNSQKLIKRVKNTIPNKNILDSLANIYKVFGDPTRLKIIFALKEGELCVKHLAEVIDMEQSAISHQLRTLRLSKLVKTKRDGKNIYYSLDDEHISDILDIGYEHITE